ncbi:MAG: hypothetical protein PHV90_10785, partial [Smithella sp.]|nr:hypothetical protein [Smithella sp.]
SLHEPKASVLMFIVMWYFWTLLNFPDVAAFFSLDLKEVYDYILKGMNTAATVFVAFFLVSFCSSLLMMPCFYIAEQLNFKVSEFAVFWVLIFLAFAMVLPSVILITQRGIARSHTANLEKFMLDRVRVPNFRRKAKEELENLKHETGFFISKAGKALSALDPAGLIAAGQTETAYNPFLIEIFVCLKIMRSTPAIQVQVIDSFEFYCHKNLSESPDTVIQISEILLNAFLN